MISLIVAYSRNKVIGNKGIIPWKIKGEQSRFKELTTSNVVIMGRHSYEEIGHPLPNRTTIVISSTKNFDAENCMTASSLQEALKFAGERDVYISGGGGVYKESLPLVDRMYVTEIDAEIDGDTFFPNFDKDCFTKEIVKKVTGELPYSYVTYIRKQEDVMEN